ncbi:MAG: exonuclease domain-containing protein [Limnoraphis sp.]
MPDYIVIDTEGNPLLKEIAVIDSSGILIFEAIVTNSSQSIKTGMRGQPLVEVLNNFIKVIQNKILVFHYAEHDLKVLYYSFKAAGITPPKLTIRCTWELSKFYYPRMQSYSLEALSKFLHLKINGKRFNSSLAHRAKYDALFTHQLYQHLMKQSIITQLKSKPNPFVNNRVDTPFQQHPDWREIFEGEFHTLTTIVDEISQDSNHQSRGIIVIGEPGSGKTHLMMRLAREILDTNRLLYIRQPNNAEAVIFHTYSRILESLIQPVPSSSHTQLEHLLAHSFAKIIQSQHDSSGFSTQKDDKILQVIQKGPLKLFSGLAQAETKTRWSYWQHIEKRALEWWVANFSTAGYAPQILKGIVRFCSYSDSSRRQIVTQWLAMNDLPGEELERVKLSSWPEGMSREEVSLEAIKVLGCLSLLEKPLLIIFDQLEGLGLPHNARLLRSFGEAIKEILTHVPNSLVILNLFPDRWQQFQQIFDGSVVDRISQSQIILRKPDSDSLKRLLNLRAETVGVNIDELFSSSELNEILQSHSIRSALNAASSFYQLKVQGIPLPKTDNVDLSSSVPKSEHPWQNFTERLERMEKLISRIAEKLDIEVEEIKPEAITVQNQLEYAPENNEVILELQPYELVPVSTTHTPIKQYFRKQKDRLTEDFAQLQVLTDSDDIGKLETIIQFFQATWQQLEITTLSLGKRVIPEHLVISTEQHKCVIGFLHLSGNSFFHRMKNYNELMSYHRELQFKLCRDETDYQITGRKSFEELERFQNSSNGQLILLDLNQRVTFELIYQTIVDIQNRDLEISSEQAIQFISSESHDFWLWKCLTR